MMLPYYYITILAQVSAFDDAPEELKKLLALIKLVFLAVEEASKKWTFRHRDWAMINLQLIIFFGNRLGKQA